MEKVEMRGNGVASWLLIGGWQSRFCQANILEDR